MMLLLAFSRAQLQRLAASLAGAALLACAAMLGSPAAQAQTTLQPSVRESDIIVTAPQNRCADGELAQRLACMNKVLAERAAAPSLGDAAPDIHAPPIALGLANLGATKQRLGANYGVSVLPARPAPPRYAFPRP